MFVLETKCTDSYFIGTSEGGILEERNLLIFLDPKKRRRQGFIRRGALIIGRHNYIYKFPNLLQTTQDGQQYHCKHLLSCSAQLEAFQKVLEKMAEKPEEYIREKGRRTTNPAEGFHGTCLAYRDKRIDLNCQHYECKANMASKITPQNCILNRF